MEELYNKYSKLVYNYLKSLCNNSETAEELTQETFYKAIKSVNKFKGECKVSTWLCQIAKNVFCDYLSKEKKAKFISLDDDYIKNLIVEKNLEENVEDKSKLINLYKQIHKLDEKTREVFYLRIRGEFSFKEIGEILNQSEQWARTIYYRGKIKLKEELNNE